MKTPHLSIIVVSFLMFGSMLNVSGTLMTPESKIQLLTGKPTYVPGEKIQIIGAFNPNDLIHIDLINPFDGTKNSTLLQSDPTGHFRTNYIVPYDAVNGTWEIVATSGFNHASMNIQVISSNYGLENKNATFDSVAIASTYSPLKQFKSGTAASDVKCKQDLQLIFKAEDSSPVCVTSDTAQKLIYRGWAIAGFTFGGGPGQISPIKMTHGDMIVVEDMGTTVIGNQTYYFTTLNDTLTSYPGIAAIPFAFHGVDFTLFPSVFSAGPPGSCGDTNFGAAVKFADRTYERLNVHIPGSPCIENYTETVFTNHENSQVGLEDYYGKIRLLVSSDNQPSSALQLFLLVNSPYQNPAEPVGIDVYLNNTTSKPLVLTDSSNWPRNDLTSGMCSNLPFGISILDGYYDEQNMTGAKSLLLYGTAPCPFLPQIKSYTFEPFSTKATQYCDTLFSCTGLVDMKKHFDIGDYVDSNNPHQTFKTGTYTIVAGDKWGDISIQHFTEADAIAYDKSSLLSKGN